MNQPGPIDELATGIPLPALAPELVTRERILSYAGASGDFNPMHVDEVLNMDAGGGGVFAHGMLGTGFLGRVVTDRLGDIPLSSLAVRCTKVVRPGARLFCSGAVQDRTTSGRDVVVRFGLRATDDEGDVTHDGTASVVLPMRELDQYGGDDLDESSLLVRWRAIG